MKGRVKENAAEEAGQGVFSWLQYFGTCVSVLGPVYLNAVPRMMAYMSLILQCS